MLFTCTMFFGSVSQLDFHPVTFHRHQSSRSSKWADRQRPATEWVGSLHWIRIQRKDRCKLHFRKTYLDTFFSKSLKNVRVQKKFKAIHIEFNPYPANAEYRVSS
jgi:hypothetical protein